MLNDRLPRICFLAPNAFPLLANHRDIQVVGGAELQQVLVARGLARRGYPVSMICLDFGQPDACEIDGVVVHKAHGPDEGIPVLRFLWPRLTSIWGCLERADADIYYQRAAGMLTGVMAAYSRRRGRRSVFAVAGDPMIRFARDRKIYEYGLRNVDCVVVQNSAQQQFLEERFGRESVIIPNCYEPEPRSGEPVETDVLWVSTLRQLKRPDRFLDLAAAVPSCRFTMIGGAGDGEAALYDAIRDRARTLPNVRFVGFAPYSEVSRYFDGTRLFVNTSETEGFPNTFLQAWARKVPTLSFIDCGARFRGEPVGQVVASEEEMAVLVRKLLANDAERIRLGSIARDYVAMHHFPERVLDAYEKVFRSLLATRVEPGSGWSGVRQPK